MGWVLFVGAVVIAYLLLQIWHAIQEARRPPPEPQKWMVGELTEHSLKFYCGADWAKPTLIAVQGVLFDVTKAPELYGRSECCVALWAAAALIVRCSKGWRCARVHTLRGVLQQRTWRAPCMTASRHTPAHTPHATRHATPGHAPTHGPTKRCTEGTHAVYAGREVARALAKDSMAAEDCTADLSGCSDAELQRLQAQVAHIRQTYDEVGTVRRSAPARARAAVGLCDTRRSMQRHVWCGVAAARVCWPAARQGPTRAGCVSDTTRRRRRRRTRSWCPCGSSRTSSWRSTTAATPASRCSSPSGASCLTCPRASSFTAPTVSAHTCAPTGPLHRPLQHA
jgi:hypothetical protein